MPKKVIRFFFFFNDTATTEIYTLSLHDALPIFQGVPHPINPANVPLKCSDSPLRDRKSTRLNSSHTVISYAVFCLKKKEKYENFVSFMFSTQSGQNNRMTGNIS